MNHLKGPGTPITDPLATDPLVITGICNTCHNRPFDGVYHPYRINVNAGSLTNPGIVDINDACGQCHGGGDNSTSNPPAPGVPYRTKAELALVANGIHDSSGVYYPVTFSYTVIPNTYTVNVTATVDCGGACPPLEYDWDWGDGSANGTANPDSHTYALAGTKTITLTIKLASNHLNAGSVARTLTLANLDLPPAASNSCVWNANTWTMTVTDTSTDDGPDADALPGDGDSLLKLNVDWGDGSVRSLATGGSGVQPRLHQPGQLHGHRDSDRQHAPTRTRTGDVRGDPGVLHYQRHGVQVQRDNRSDLCNRTVVQGHRTAEVGVDRYNRHVLLRVTQARHLLTKGLEKRVYIRQSCLGPDCGRTERNGYHDQLNHPITFSEVMKGGPGFRDRLFLFKTC